MAGKAGRRTRYSPEMLKAVADMASAGASDFKIFKTLGISRSTFYNWLKTHTEFEAAITKARLPKNLEAEITWLNTCRQEAMDWFLQGLRDRGVVQQEGDGLGSYSRLNALPPSWVVDRLQILEERGVVQKLEVVLSVAVPPEYLDDPDDALECEGAD